MSSIMMNLDLIEYVIPSKNKNADSIAQLMIEVRKNYNEIKKAPARLHFSKLLMIQLDRFIK